MARYKLGPKSRPADLLAALGERLATYQDRDYIYIASAKQLVSHESARRGYRCACGSTLVTRCDNGKWLTVCAADTTHAQSGFISGATYQYRRARELAERKAV